MANNLGIQGLKVRNINILSQEQQNQIKSLLSQVSREHPEIFYSPTNRPRITLKLTYHGEPGGGVYAGFNNLQNVCKTELGEDGTPYFTIVLGLEEPENLYIYLAHELGHAILTNKLAGSPFEHLMIDDGTDMMPKYAMAYMQETFAWSYAYKWVKDMQYLKSEYGIAIRELQFSCRSYIAIGAGGLFGDGSTTMDRLQQTLYSSCDLAALAVRLGINAVDNYIISRTNFNLGQFVSILIEYISIGDRATLNTVQTLANLLTPMVNWATSQ